MIALSLTLAPVTSAVAAMQMRAQAHDDMAMQSGADDAMSDCMKAMGKTVPAKTSDCPCCDTHHKMPCQDMQVCLAKCANQALAVATPAVEPRRVTMRVVALTDRNKPPDWLSGPPAEPPRLIHG